MNGDLHLSRRRRWIAGFGAVVLTSGISVSSAGAELGELGGIDRQVNVYEAAAESAPCEVEWTLLAAIAGFASDHGRFAQPVPLSPTDVDQELVRIQAQSAMVDRLVTEVPIRGEALDGQGGRDLILDTDGGELDGDTVHDRAVGPFQFIPSTWALYGTDGDGDGIANPDNIADAATAAAALLCEHDVDVDEAGARLAYFGTDAWRTDIDRLRAEIRRHDAEKYRTITTLTIGPRTATLTETALGEIPLTTVAGIVVHVEIADDVERMIADAAADGVVLVGGGFRTHERQIQLREAHCADIWTTPASQCSPPTAIPGTSMHETGQAIDFVDPDNGRVITRSSAQFAWLEEFAEDYGFFNLPSEAWHWSTTGG